METTEHYTEFDLVTKINGRAKYINLDELSNLSDDDLIARVRVIKDRETGREISRDQVVENWMTVKEYYSLKD